MRTKKGEKQKLREVILNKALAYFKRHGQGAAAAEKVMESVGLTKGALYSHFKNKEELFAESVCHDLYKLSEAIREALSDDARDGLRFLITTHLSKNSLENVGESCVFTSLSTDMQRSEGVYRALYEERLLVIYQLFSDALMRVFPGDSRSEAKAKAMNLYSGLVGTLSMARTMKNPKRAHEILAAGRKFLIESFVDKKATKSGDR